MHDQVVEPDPAQMAAACDESTVLLVGSAPGYAHGVIDPIEALGQIAIDKGWAENHPLASRGIIPKNVVMVYGPRNEDELEVVKALIAASHAFAHPANKRV